jgi:hypothetical protein
MLLSIPDGRSRGSDWGALGFPWLPIANIAIQAAYGGWSYWRTNQQIKQAMNISGVTTATPSDVTAAAEQFKKITGSPLSQSQLEKYFSDLIRAAPTKTQGIPPTDLVELKTQLTALQMQVLQMQTPKTQKMPTWSWILIGGVAFLALMQFGILGKGGD